MNDNEAQQSETDRIPSGDTRPDNTKNDPKTGGSLPQEHLCHSGTYCEHRNLPFGKLYLNDSFTPHLWRCKVRGMTAIVF